MDLIPLAQVAGCITGLGDSYRALTWEREEVDALTVLEQMGLEPLQLEAKEGLSLINGTSMMTGIAGHLITEAQQSLRLTLYLHAFFIEALVGSPELFPEFVHQCKPHPGQIEAARLMRELLKGARRLLSAGEIIESGNGLIQDRYSIRCLPQYMGPTLHAFELIAKQVETEGNSVDDNHSSTLPGARLCKGENFQGQHIGTGMDSLR